MLFQSASVKVGFNCERKTAPRGPVVRGEKYSDGRNLGPDPGSPAFTQEMDSGGNRLWEQRSFSGILV